MAPNVDSYQYRAAISLNNLGVAFIERACYAQAASTLADAAMVMRGVVSSDPNHHHYGSNKHQMVNTKLNDASRRWANTQNNIHHTSNNPSCVTISDDEDFFPAKDAAIDSLAVPYVVRIETFDSHNCQLPDIICGASVILFNHAMAYFCLSLVEPTTPAPGTLQTNALRLLYLSYTIACHHFQDFQDRCLLRRQIQLRILLLQKLTFLTSGLGIVNDSTEYASRLDALLSSRIVQEDSYFECSIHTARAA
jgi:hypothetical protein